MKYIYRIMLPVFIMAFGFCAFAKNAGAELEFYKKEAQTADKKALVSMARSLRFWTLANYTAPEVDDALFLKGSIEAQVKNYSAAAVTLLRHRFEFPKSPNREPVQGLLTLVAQNVEKEKRPALEKLAAMEVPSAQPVQERLSLFLSEVTKLELKNSFPAVLAEFEDFFNRFPVYEGRDRLELMLGDLYRSDKNYQAAIMQYRKVYEVYPSTRYKAASLRMIGDIYGGELKNYEQAMQYYATVLKDYPASAERAITYNHMAILSENQKDYEGAVKYITNATDLFIKDNQADKAYETLLYKSELQENRLKDYPAAVDTLNMAAKIFANHQDKFVEIKLKTAGIYAKRLKDPYGQIAAYESILEEFPLSPAAVEAMHNAAALHEKTANPLKAKALYQRLIVEHPADSLANKAQKRIDAIDKQLAKEAAAS